MLQIKHLHSRAHIISQRLQRDRELSHGRCHNHQCRFNISCPTQTHDTVGRKAVADNPMRCTSLCAREKECFKDGEQRLLGASLHQILMLFFYGTIWCMASTLNINKKQKRNPEKRERATDTIRTCTVDDIKQTSRTSWF